MKAVTKCFLFGFLIIIFGTGAYFIFKKDKIEIKLIGDEIVTIDVKNEYKDKGIVVYKNDKELKRENYALEETNDVDINKLGEYKVNYKVQYKKEEYEVTRIVKVVDIEKPVLTANIDKIERDYCSRKETKRLEYTSIDNYDEDITEKVNISEAEDKLTLTSTDTSGNETTIELPITYINKPSVESTFKVNGYAKMYVPINTAYKDEGASLKDGCGKVLSNDIVTTGNVDTSEVGEYKITYTSSKDNSLQATRTVIVYEPNVKTVPKTSNEKIIYLTFDDGPYRYTNEILKILKKYNVKVTFFVTNHLPS